MANKLFKKTSSGLTPVKFYRKTSTGLVQNPVYRKTTTGMERIDQTLVTKTKVISGYAQWNGTFRNSSGSGTANNFGSSDSRNTLVYQGKYSPYCYLGVMCFTDLFKEARETGIITKVVLKLKNNHAYYNSGLKTYISGAWSLPSTRPSSYSFANTNTVRYCNDVSFAKNGAEHKAITLNTTAINAITNNQINGFRVVSPTGFDLNNYGYFEGSGSSRPYIEITVQYDEWVF